LSDGLVVMPDGTKYVSSVQNGGVSRTRPGRPAQNWSPRTFRARPRYATTLAPISWWFRWTRTMRSHSFRWT